ncbi:MAG: ribosomal-protein-alanine N-acetyltransferase [Methylophilaceae bacterium]|jgi:ribosomal-protein-alanine N-acetyltransferase
MLENDLDAVMVIEPTIYLHPWTRGNFNDSLKSGYAAWVLTRQDEIVGYSLMSIVLDEAELLNISVAAPYQQQGLGRLLIAHMMEHAITLGAAMIFLEVRASNAAAIALYERASFVEVNVRRGYYSSENRREDAVIMKVAL